MSFPPQPNPKPERLDVENDDARQKRLQNLLEQLSTSDASSSSPPGFPAPPAGLPKFDFGDRSTSAFTPNVDLLTRVQAFLPQLEASNRELLERARANPTSVDIECVDEGSAKYIEMNLGLGVFEQKRKARAKAAAGGDAAGSQGDEGALDASSDASSSDDSRTSDSDSNSGSDDEGEGEDSGDDDAGADPSDPLTSFFNSLRNGQTASMDTSGSEASSDSDLSDDADSEEGGESDDDDEDDSEDEDDEEERQMKPLPKRARRVKPLPKRARPGIEVIGEAQEKEEGSAA